METTGFCGFCFQKFGQGERVAKGTRANYFLHEYCLAEQNFVNKIRRSLLKIVREIQRKTGYNILKKNELKELEGVRRDHKLFAIAKNIFKKMEGFFAALAEKSFQKFRCLVEATEKLFETVAEKLRLKTPLQSLLQKKDDEKKKSFVRPPAHLPHVPPCLRAARV